MIDNLVKKCLAVGIILLFIGVTIAPSINFNVVKASNDNDLVEVTTQACGIKGYGNTTVKLTRQQYQNLEQYLVDFRARLNQTTTREEAVPIFKDAVVELDKYGLLPRGMSVERAQKLVIGGYQNEKLMKRLSKLCAYKINDSDMLVNHFCLISGETNMTTFCPLVCAFFTLLSFFIMYNALFLFLTLFLVTFLSFIADLSFYFSNFISPVVFGYIHLGYFQHPAFGWIHSFGLNGNKSINGSFYGNLLRYGNLFLLRFWILWEELDLQAILSEFPGIAGFQGIRVFTPSTYIQFYLGSALEVRVGPEPPFSINIK